MIKSILSHKATELVLGAFTFWLSFLSLSLMAGKEYDGKSVIFLTLFVPLITMALIYLLYEKIVQGERVGIMPAMLVGVFGPLFGTWVYSLITTFPALRTTLPINTIQDPLSQFVSVGIIGILSVLTYTGMLGALILNIIISPLLGYWLSRRK